MKKTLMFATTLGLAALAFGANAQAGSQDAYPTIPDACTVTPQEVGPSRVTHSPSLGEEQLPPCGSLDVCVVFQVPVEPTPTPTGTPDGPSRLPHAVPRGCEDIDEACWLEITPAGASRTVHQARPAVPADLQILIPQDCQKVLFDSIAPTPIPSTGSNSGPITLVAAALLLVGGGLLIAQRRTANR